LANRWRWLTYVEPTLVQRCKYNGWVIDVGSTLGKCCESNFNHFQYCGKFPAVGPMLAQSKVDFLDI